MNSTVQRIFICCSFIRIVCPFVCLCLICLAVQFGSVQITTMTRLTKSISVSALVVAMTLVLLLSSVIITTRSNEILLKQDVNANQQSFVDDKIIPLKCDNDYGVSCTFFNVQAGDDLSENNDGNQFTCGGGGDEFTDDIQVIEPMMKQFNYYSGESKRQEQEEQQQQNGQQTIGHTNDDGVNDVDGNGLMYPPEMKTYIEFVESSLERIPDKLFKHYCNVLELVMPGVGLKWLDADSFNGATYLETIDLSSNRVPLVNANVFRNLTNVHRIDLSYNRIASLDVDAFTELVKLNYLDLTSNCISQLPDGIFAGLTSLEVLSLDHNQLKGALIGDDLFETNINLAYVSLQYNQLTQIGPASFANLTQLRYLRLSYNRLKEFDQINFVTNLYVSHNDLELLKITSNIKVLDAQYNQLYDLECDDGWSNGAGDVVIGDISGDKVPTMMSSSSSPSRLSMEILLLNNNHLNNFHCIDQMTELIVLNMAGNDIKLIKRSTFLMVSKLTNLQLENNKITLIESGAFATLTQLEYLDLSNNLLKSFDLNLFPPPGPLLTFYIGNNKIGSSGVCALVHAFHEFIVDSDLDGNSLNCTNTLLLT